MRERIRRAAAVVCGAAAFFLLIALFARVTHYTAVCPVLRMEEGYTAVLHDVTYEDVTPDTLMKTLPAKITRGDRLRIARVIDLPALEIPAPTLFLDTRYAAVEVFLDEEKIASHDMERLARGGFISSQYYYISLPDDYAGKVLTIDYYFSENNANYNIVPPVIGNADDLVRSFFDQYRFPLFCGIFLFVFGAFFIIVSLLFSVMIPELMGQLVSAVISLTFGVWILTTYRFICLFLDSTYVSTADYVAYFQFVPLFYLLFVQIHEIDNRKWYKRVAITSTAISEGLVLLHFTGLVHITSWRIIYYATAGIMMAMYLFYDYKDVRRGNTGILNVLQMMGPTFFCICGFIAMLMYMADGFFTGAMAPDSSLLVFTTGCMGFALTRFTIFLVLLLESRGIRIEFESLSRMANADPLTGLYNRHYLTDLFDTLDRGRRDYCIISLDLNNLKYVNDTFGHGKGDQLIMDFSDILKRVYKRSASCCRAGGDEFVVLIENRSKEYAEALIDEMHRAFSALDDIQPIIPHSVASGCAFRHERNDATAHDVYMLADQRMYENKKLQKEAQGSVSLAAEEMNAPATNVEADFRQENASGIGEEDRIRLDAFFNAIAVAADTVGVFVHDMRYDYSRWSVKLVEHFGLPGEYMSGANAIWLTHIHPEDRALYKESIGRVFDGTDTEHALQYRVLNSEGKYVVCTCRGTVTKSLDGKPEFFCGTIRDFGNESQVDAMTGLRNQYAFSEDVSELLLSESKASFLLIGISSFNEINDLYGYEYGSRVLEQFGRLVVQCAGNAGFVYRMDGARFLILGRGNTKDEMTEIYELIRQMCRGDFFVDGRRMSLSICGGLLMLENFRVNELTIISCLSYALNESRNKKHGDLYVFSAEMTDDSRKRLEMLNTIRASILDGFKGFYLCYQYLVDAKDGGVLGAEALLRWKDDYYGNVPPGQFVNVIEQDPLFPELGTWILKQAMRDGIRFLAQNKAFVMNVNLSYSQLEKPDFVDTVTDALKESDFPPENLCLEITESCRMLDTELLRSVVNALKSQGVRFALDDFGTGFSSLSILRQIPFDVIKVDREFVMEIEEKEEARQAIRAIVSLALVYHAAVCVEGVETQGQSDILRPLGIKTFQGFLYARPEPIENLLDT